MPCQWLPVRPTLEGNVLIQMTLMQGGVSRADHERINTSEQVLLIEALHRPQAGSDMHMTKPPNLEMLEEVLTHHG